MPSASRPNQSTKVASLIAAVLASVGLVLWMANPVPFRFGTLAGTLIAVLASAAWVYWSVPGSEADVVSWRATSLAKKPGEPWSPIVWASLASVVLGIGIAIGGYDGLPATIAIAIACLVPPAFKRPGLAVLLVICALYLPLLGTYGLWDPWETHYGEVAREIRARNDWISLWWAQDNWFWSKPVFLFWAEAWAMGVLDVDTMPDANPMNPEWAIRLPTFALTLLALGVVYATIKRQVGTRAAVLAVLVTATMPQFFFISRQAITDLPLVAAITVAACCLLVAVDESPNREVRAVQVGPFQLSLRHLVVFSLVLAVLPQAAYLISRNLSWLEGSGLVAHPDHFLYGSAGNAGIPGNPMPRDQLPRVRGLGAQPFVQGVFWSCALAAIVVAVRHERRRRRLLMVVFYFACAIAFLAKGLLGIAIPGLLALLYLVVSRRWALLGDGELGVARGALIVTAVGMPWYLAMYVRHGAGFTNRLLIHDHINRLAAGVHGDQGTITYFVGQLGYAAFPWIALIPMAVLALLWFRSAARATHDRATDTMMFFGLWLVSSFVVFSAMMTKFHHYILPSVVPAGILVGIAAAPIWGARRPPVTVLAFGAGALLVAGFTYLTGAPRGIVPPDAMDMDDWVLRRAEPAVAVVLLASALTLAIVARRSLLAASSRVSSPRWQAAVGVGAILGATVIAFVGRDLSWATNARPQGYERLIHLFVYNYDRLWPPHLDYRPILTGFAIASTLLIVCLAFRTWRPVAVRALTGVAILFCAWGLNVYMIDLSDHWSIQKLAARYYEDRQSADEPLLAWQMNWKGENFYTGNRVHAFPELDNERLKKWLAENHGRHAYVVLEHKRLPSFKKLVSDSAVRELSTRRDNNKFVLVELDI